MKVLLHICCGVCAAGSIERLRSEGYEVKGYFYNPNIYPEDEYKRRLEAVYKVSRETGVEIEEGRYDPESWLKETSVYGQEPEGGARCSVCFRFRLKETSKYLDESGCDLFATTLTISPHKPADIINAIGKEVGGEKYLEKDFKKKAGFDRANILSREWDVYRQHYCGCIYSMRVN